MPNVEAIKEWVHDLRTTDAPQAVGALQWGGMYCCLGRACEVYMRHEGGKWRNHEGEAAEFVDATRDSESSCLPEGVAAWFGFANDEYDAGNPKLLTADGEWCYAADLNDIHRLPFAEIADCVERTYLAEPTP